MAIELARTQALPRPWGVVDLGPWSHAAHKAEPIGEIWYERPGKPAKTPALLLKLLFTSEPLSIQVHPNDAHAQSMGLPNGKTEAWYVLSAASGAKVAVGLDRRLTRQELRQAVADGSILDRVVWRAVSWRTTSFPSPPVRSTPSAPGLSLPRSSSAARQPSACSIMAASASCTSIARSRWRTPAPPAHGSDRTG